MAFKHQRHNIILSIIQGMDLAFLNQAGAYFAGGTAISMAFGEHRLSFDIDFLASEQGMRLIRERVMDEDINSLFIDPDIELLKSAKDRYSIRMIARYRSGEPIKIELVHEARVALGSEIGLIAQAPNLMTIDKSTMVAQKCLAIADRGLDVGFHHRDYWDLCVLVNQVPTETWWSGVSTAVQAYSQKVIYQSLAKVQTQALNASAKDFQFLQVFDTDIFLQGSDTVAQLLELSHAHHP